MTNGASPNTEPNRDECLLACVAHLAVFGGLWLIGPLVIYLWKGRESRFLAFHSVQAMLLALAMIALGALAGVAMLAAMVAGVAGAKASQAAPAIGLSFAGLLLAAVILVPIILALVAGVRALTGQWWSMPIIGRITTRWLAQQSAQ